MAWRWWLWLVLPLLGVMAGLLLGWWWRVARRFRAPVPVAVLGGGGDSGQPAALPRVSLAFLTHVVNTLPDAVVAVSADGLINYLNTQAAALGGDASRPWQGEPLLHLLRSPALHQAVAEVFDTRHTRTVSLQEFTPQPVALRARLNWVQLPGREALVVIVLENETELKHLQQVRLDFVHNASHELRTPIAHIMGAAEILASQRDRLSEGAQGFVDILKGESTRLKRLTEDLLTLAKTEQPATTPAFTDLCAVAREVCGQGWPGATSTLTLHAPPDPLPVPLGHEQLVQVVGNLVENAMKYTQGGQVNVTVGEEDGVAVLAVADTGAGIPLVEQGRIFERFYRVDVHRSRETGGTGLGLSIVKNLVEKTGGEVSVKSAVGQGSTFTVRLPVKRQQGG